MNRLVAILVLSLAASASALACPDHKSASADSASSGKPSAASGKHCDMPAATAAAPLPADGTHVKLAVAGMHCGACAEKVKTALIGVDGVKGANVDVTTGVAEVAFDEKKTSTDKLLAAVAATSGFTATIATN